MRSGYAPAWFGVVVGLLVGCATGKEELDEAPNGKGGTSGGGSRDAAAGTSGRDGATSSGGGSGTGGSSSGQGGGSGIGGVTSDASGDTSSTGGTLGGGGSMGGGGTVGGGASGAGSGGGGASGAGTGGGGASGSAGKAGGAGTGGATGCDAGPVELCNGVDDDGDGLIDEYSSRNTMPCNGCTPMQRNNFVYWFCTTSRDWAPARDNCTAKNAQLASIHDQAENDFVTSSMSTLGVTGRAWFGLNDRTTEGTYAWLDGTPVDFKFFTCSTTANPSTGSEDCANILVASKCWDDDDCSGHSFPYICKASHQPAACP